MAAPPSWIGVLANAYCDKSDLVERFGAAEIAQLLDPDGAGQESSERLAAAVGAAAGEIDARIGPAYKLPIDNPRDYPLLVQAACFLAREALYDDAPPERVAADARFARQLADGWRSGRFELVTAAHETLARTPAGEDLAALEPDPAARPDDGARPENLQ